uniref:Lipid/polyisoprenoid-binding YceI-like domain-containing protein n=1 Tax=Desulfovibrio sp. U5L TaxID=596152 RepID=I2Q480_9BACT
MKTILPALCILAALGLAPCPAPAQAADPQPAADAAKAAAPPAPVVDGVTLDTPHISTTFWIRHILAPVAGRFDEAAGTIDLPAKSPEKGHVRFTVKTQSVDTGVAARDNHLRTAEFLDTAVYPEMTFVSDRIVPGPKGVYNVTGKLTIKDVTKTVTIPVRALGTKPNPMMPCVDVSGYEASLSLNRLEYHVGTGKYFKMGAVGDTVDIRLAGETLGQRPNCVPPPQPQQ